MGAYKYIQAAFEKSFAERTDSFRSRLQKFRKEKTVERAEKPTNPGRARALGYKARKDFVIARVRIKRGKRSRGKPDQGRKPGRNRKFVNPGLSLQAYCEAKVKRRFPNLTVINSYLVGQDGADKYFEVILQDRHMRMG
ncbi:MAG: 50S ribosomal protein L15e [Candidatus Micrarchaeota archaeon]